MPRDFDGGSSITFGSDSTIDDFSAKTALMWTRPNTDANEVFARRVFTKSDGALTPSGWGWDFHRSGGSTGHVILTQDFSVTDGTWQTPNNSAPDGALHHVGYTYDRGSSNFDPVLYVDGTTPALTETPPVGNSNGDAAATLRAGEDDSQNVNTRYKGRMAFLVYDNTLFTSASVNRHRWWGVAPGGPSTLKMWHPMWTDSLVNKGTATANGTNSGTTMISLPRVERMWGSMMGVGR